MQTRDQIEIIESAYALDAPDARWQYRLTELVAEQWGGTAASFLYDASEPGQLTCGRVIVRKTGERSIVDAPQSICLRDAALRQALFLTRPHLGQLADLVSPELGDTDECRRVLAVTRDLGPGPYSVVLRTLDRSMRGVFFVLPSRPIGDRMRAMWGEVAVHIGLAYRLRRALVGTATGDARGKGDPAVLRRALRHAAVDVLANVALWARRAPVAGGPGGPRH